MVKVDVDESVEVAWRGFEHRLAADLVELAAGGTVRVEVPTGRGGWSPVALTFARRPRTILVRANGSPPLRGAGSRPRRRPPEGVPLSRMFRVGAEPATAAWAIGVLRKSYDVIHPSFLRQTRRDASGEPVRPVSSAGNPTAAVAGGLALPTSSEHLDELVERAVSSVIGVPVVRDPDGDIPLVGDHGTVYVRVRRHQPVVEVFALLERIEDGDDPARAVWIANARNARSSLATYVVMHGCLVVRVAMWCHPFVPGTLLRAVDQVMSVLEDAADRADEADDDEPATVVELAADEVVEISGDDEAPSELAPELLTIIQLDVAEPGSVSPELAARIFGYDRDRLLAGIRTSEAQMLEWRRSIEAARERDEEEATVCAGESASWQATTDLLRAALRVAVQR